MRHAECMSTATHGTTAVEAVAETRRSLGDALRAARVVLGTAFEVIILGRVDPTPATCPRQNP